MEGLCIVCGKILGECVDLSEHLIDKSTHMMDSHHSFYEKRVTNSNFTDPCFCGGSITKSGCYPNHWQAICEKCGYVWAED